MPIHSKCPHCGVIVRSYEPGEHEYGSPLQRCSACGREFVDEYHRELALSGTQPGENRPFPLLYLLGAAFGLLLVYCEVSILAAGAMDTRLVDKPMPFWMNYGVLVIGVAIALAFTVQIGKALARWREKKAFFAQERLRSLKRLEDREYASTLSKAGLFVPEKYL